MLSIVLSRRDFRESDQVISIYTLEKGKIEVLARGVKKILSKNSAHLEPFCLVEVDAISGKGLILLGGTQSIKAFKNIRQDFLKSSAAGYLVKFLEKSLAEGVPDKNVFNLVVGWLDFVDSNQKFSTRLLDAFIIKFLRISGWDLNALENLKAEVKNNLENFLNSNWDKINELTMFKREEKILHELVWDSVRNNLEIKLLDWDNLNKTC